LVDVTKESRVQITIVEDVAAGKIIARIILLAATMRKDSRSIWRSKIRRTIPRELLSSNTTIDAGTKISSSKEEPKINY
jgi:hypothetical protein